MSFEKSLARNLLKASGLAYDVSYEADAQQPEDVTAGLRDMGFNPATLKWKLTGNNPLDVDACYCVENNEAAVLAFRGTLPPTLGVRSPKLFFQVLADWLNDGDVLLVKGNDLPGMVHQGFLKSLDNLWSDIEIWLKQSNKKLYITGHSKGGGLAYLAAYRLSAALGVKPAAVYTFAAPRVGNDDFAARFSARLNEVWRVEYQDDLVPHLPSETATWLSMYEKLRSNIPHGAPLDASWDAASNFERLLEQIGKRVDKGLPSYASAGELQFIDWDNSLEPDSHALKLKREAHMVLKLIDPLWVIKDHLLESYKTGLE